MLTRLAILVVLLSVYGSAEDAAVAPGQTPKPSARLDLSVAGYKDLSAMARRADKVNLTIDFIDSGHLLLTYNPKKMIVRLPECPPSHDDHLIHAAVLEIDTGKILNSADWYLHDGRRYLWPLGSGKFLLRKLNSLFLLDSDLHEKLLLTSPQELLWVTVTPDGKQIITETMDDEQASKSKKKLVRIEFRNSQTMEVQRVIKSEKEAHIEATSSGFVSVIPGLSRKVWLVRFGLSEHQRDNITRVRTRLRTPDVLYLSSNAILIGRDSASHPGYSVSAFTVTGNFLWRQHWDEHRYSLLIERSEDGSRFAVSTLRLEDQSPSTGDGSSDLPVEGLEQTVQVFNTGSGEAILSVDTMPVVLSGQNFALSPDGRKLAVLHGSSINLYDLPEMSPDELAKYTAVKADVPGLYAPPAPSQENSNEAAFTAADENGAAPEGPKPDVASLPNANPANGNSAQSPSTQPAPVAKPTSLGAVPVFKSRQQIVALDVVVADAKGHPVKDIPKEQFAVKEDGKPQTISYFDEVHANSSSAPSPPQTPPDPKANTKPANIFTNDKPPQAPSAITVILYDLLNTPAPEQQSAKLELLNFIEHKPKDERFALCALTNGLRMIQGFTPDESILTRALKKNKGSLSYSGFQDEEETDRMLVGWLQQGVAKNVAQLGAKAGAPSEALSEMAGRMEQDMAERRSRDLEMRMAVTTDAFTQLARYLSALPGRKSLIWLSGSFPLGIFPGMDFRNPYSANKTEGDQMKQAVNLLAESHVAVYPVDVRGLSNFPATASTSNSGLDLSQAAAQPPSFNNQVSNTQRFDELSNLNSTGGIGPNLANNSPFMDEAMDHGIMDKIASDTGGKAFYNANGIEQAMDIAVEQETNYYALSYTSLNKKYDGKFRRIKVSLPPGEKKYHVIYRSGYYAVDPDAPSPLSKDATTGFGLASMQHDAPQSRQLLFEARVVPIGKPEMKMDPRAARSAPAKKKHQNAEPPKLIEMQHYDIDYAITPSQLHFDSTPDGLEHGAMNFMVASFDGDGTVRTSIASHVKGDLKPDEYNEVMIGGFRLHEEVEVPVAAASLRMGVQDSITGRLGTIEIPLPVKAQPGVEESRRQRMPEIEPD